MRTFSMSWFRTLVAIVVASLVVGLLPTGVLAASMGGGPSIGGGSFGGGMSMGARGGGLGGASGFRGAPSIGGMGGSFSGGSRGAPMGGSSFGGAMSRPSVGGSFSRPMGGGQRFDAVAPRSYYGQPSQQYRAPMMPRSYAYGGTTRQVLPSPSAGLGQRRAPISVPRSVQAAPRIGQPARSLAPTQPSLGAAGRAGPYALYGAQGRGPSVAQALPRTPTRQSPVQSMTRPGVGPPIPQIGRASDLGRVVAQRPTTGQPGTNLALPPGARQAPQAAFRGPAAGRALTPVTPQVQQRTAQQLTQQLRQENAKGLVTPRPGVTRDAIGNLIPKGAQVLDRRGTPAQRAFLRVTDRLGLPANTFPFRPNWNWNWDWNWGGGWGWNGVWWGTFWFPWYWSNPWWNAWWLPGFWPSVYSFWGWSPGWIYPSRGYYDPFALVYVSGGCDYGGGYCSSPSYGYNTYNVYGSTQAVQPAQPALDYAGVQQALADIRSAWVNGDITLLANHLTDQVDVQVYFDGKYTYSTKMSDYYAMTADTLATTRTVAMSFDDPVWISATEVFVSGSHTFDDPIGERHTVYLSYRLRQLGTGWYIVAVGSSTQPIQSPYQDFRTG